MRGLESTLRDRASGFSKMGKPWEGEATALNIFDLLNPLHEEDLRLLESDVSQAEVPGTAFRGRFSRG
ncbi:MAG: hypothetical protein AB7I48_11025, partial [Planctomycetaceae bacterium]